MNRITKIGSALLLLALFAGCKGKTTTKKDETTKKPTPTSITTSRKSTTQETSTKEHVGDKCTLTIAGDTSGDTATLKNTVKVFNKTKKVELKTGDQFDSGDEISVTLFNLATDVKIRVYNNDYDYFPWFSYEKLTGEEATTGVKVMEFSPTKDIIVTYMVDDGEEAVTYAKFNSSIAATDVEVTYTVSGMDEAEHTVVDGDTVVVGSSLYYTIKNKSTTNKVIFAIYNDGDLDTDSTVVIEPNTTLEEYDGILGDIKVSVEPYAEYSASGKNPLPTSTAVTVKLGDDIINGVNKPKYTVIDIYVNNASTSDYIAKVVINGAAIESKLLKKNTDFTFEKVLLTDNIDVVIDTFEGPTATINTCDGVYLSAGYMLGEEEIGFESGDTIPEGLELSLLAFNITDPYSELTITITVGGVEVYSHAIDNNENGLYINGIYATDDIVIIIS